MGKVRFFVGKSGPHGLHGQDYGRTVEFEAERLGEYAENDRNQYGRVETLYRSEDGRLIVAWRSWSAWQGEFDHFGLEVVSEADLGPGGRYEWLGRQSGFSRAVSLDEALALQKKEGYDGL